MRRRTLLRIGGAATVASGTAIAPVGATTDGFEPLGSVTVPGAKELVIGDDVGYVAATDGFATVDLSEPTDPTVLADRTELLPEHPNGPLVGIWDGKLDGDRYAIGGPAHDRRDVPYAAIVYDVSDPADPEELLVHETSFYHHNLDIEDGTLFLCGNDGGHNPLVCVDVETGEELGRWSVVDAEPAWSDVFHPLRMLHDVWVEDGIAHCSYWNAGTWLVDVSDPRDPTPIVGVRGLDPEEQSTYSRSGHREAFLGLPGNDHVAMPARNRSTEGNLFAVGEEAWAFEEDAGSDSLGAVEIWRAVDGDGQRLARIEPPPTPNPTRDGVWTTAHNFDFVEERLYTSWYRGGVRVHDVTDPNDPREVASWRDEETTSFWTVQRGDSGEYLAASSYRDPSADDPEQSAEIYTFPEPTDQDGEPADAGRETPTPEAQRGVGLLAGVAALAAAFAAWRRR